MSESKTLEGLNQIKTIMMLSVILYHSMALWNREGWFNTMPAESNQVITYIATWLNTFHIYVFVFVSGYLFYYLKYECGKYQVFKFFCWAKFKRLMIPYFFIALFWCMPFHAYFFQADIFELIKKYVFMISPSQLWFVVMLFVIMILTFAISDFLLKRSKFQLLVICVAIYLLGTVLGFMPLPFQIATAVRYMPFYIMGMCFRKWDIQKSKRHVITWVLINLVVFSIYYYVSGMNELPYKILSIALLPLVNVLGIIMVLTLQKTWNNSKIWNTRIYTFLKDNSFTMYLFHQQIVYCSITLLNGRLPSWGVVALNFVISLVISAILSCICNQFSATRFLIGKQKKGL